MTHVIIASVPQREHNLYALLVDLAQQTHALASISILLNGYAEIEQIQTRVNAFTIPIYLDHSTSPRSAGSRWLYITQHLSRWNANDIFVVIDDDFRIGPTYVQETVDALTETGAAMVSWYAYRSEHNYLHPETRKRGECISYNQGRRNHERVLFAGTGVCAIHLEVIRGIETHPLVPELFGMGGDDEFLICLWLWQHKQTCVRPRGRPSLTSVFSLQKAEHASHIQHGTAWTARRVTLIKEYGMKLYAD